MNLSTDIYNINDSNGNRTRVTAVKGRCLNRLTMEPYYSATQLSSRCTSLTLTKFPCKATH